MRNGGQKHLERAAFGASFLFHFANVLEVFNKAVKDVGSAVLMDNFTSPEEDGYFYLIAILKETPCMTQFGFVIMVIRLGADLDFLDLDNSLTLFSFLLFLLRLVFEFAVVHNSANRRHSSSRHFHQVIAMFLGGGDSLIAGENPQLFAFGSNDSYFPGTDLFVAAHP